MEPEPETDLQPQPQPQPTRETETERGRARRTEAEKGGQPARAEGTRSIQCTPRCSGVLQQQLHNAATAVGWSLSRPPAGRRHAGSAAPYLAASVVWHDGSSALTPSVQASQLLPHQWLSTIAGLGAYTQKNAWERLLRQEQSEKSGRAVRSPRTLLLPDESARLAGLAEQQVYIAKPSDGSQGSNIMILRGRTEVICWWRKQQEHSQCPADLCYVLQDYLGEPLTLRGRKFDLRLYLVCVCPAPPCSPRTPASFVSSVQHRHETAAVSARVRVCVRARAPVRRLAVDCNGKWAAYLYKEGMVRLCSSPYAAVVPAGAELETATGEERQHRGQDAEHQTSAERREAALPSGWQLAHLSNTSLKNLAMDDGTAPQQGCTELMWGGLLHDAIQAGPAAAAASAQEHAEGRLPIEQCDGERRVAAFWSELVAIAEVTARALRRGVTLGARDSSTRAEGAAGGTDTRDPTDNEAPESEAWRGLPAGGHRASKANLRCGMFQVLGLDVMLDAAHRAWVLEVNARPSVAGINSCSSEWLSVSCHAVVLRPFVRD